MRITAFRTATSLFGLVGMLALSPSQALAQAEDGASDYDEIVVTAQRREEKSVDVPITIATLNTDQLATANVNSLADTAKLTPGLRFDAQGAGVQPTIRGVGTAISTSGGGPNVAVYVDGFFQPNANSTDMQLMRVKNIQVLKGPQGTLFGRNTTGGAILVTSNDPSQDASAEFKASYGRFNALTLQGYATAGLAENIAFDIEGLYRRGDGYFTDIATNNSNRGEYENWSIRAGVKVDLSDSASLVLRYTHTENRDPTTQMINAYVDKDGTAGFLSLVSPAGRAIYGASSSKGMALTHFYFPSTTYTTTPGKILLDARAESRATIDAVQGTLKLDLGFADFTSYTQYRREKTPYYGDLDATAVPGFGILVGIDDQSFSQEFLLNSKPGGRLQWTAGLSYFQYRDTWAPIEASFGGPYFAFGGSSTNTKSYGAFADLTYELSDKLFLTAGGRFSHDTVGDAYFTTNPFTAFYTGPQGQFIPWAGGGGVNIGVATLKNDSFTPRVVLRYKPSDNSSIYASWTRGYKAGLLNVGGLSQEPVKPEKINAFELGYKYDDRALSVDFAGFYYDYKNLQVSSYQSGAAQIRNAASSEIYGLEGQIRYRLTSAFSVNAGAAWTHARYKDFKNAPYYSWCDPAAAATSALYCVPVALGGSGPGGLLQTFIDASGYKMQRSPEFTANLGGSYTADLSGGKLVLSGNVYYTSSFFADPEQQFKQDGYTLVSLRAAWTDPSDRFTVAVYGDNLTGERYQTQVLFNTVGIGNVFSAPATWGVQLGAKF